MTHETDIKRQWDGLENTKAAKHANDFGWYVLGFAAIFAFGYFIAEFAKTAVR